MADTKITALTALTAADPANDVIPIVDVSDTTMAASGTTKKISVNNILGASGTATLASATITGDLTVRTTGLTTTASAVGINTASPTANTLTIGANRFIICSDSQSKFGDNGLINGAAADGNTQIQFFGSKSLFFNEGVSTRMTLNSTGLLVGTANNFASSRLCVQGTAGTSTPDVTIGIPVNSSGNTNLAIGRSASTNGYIFLDAYKAGVGGTELVLNSVNGGSVLIGLSTVVAAGGCLQLKSGITFPATQVASSDANTLDDYEEGTWAIGLEFGGASTGITTNSNQGKYTKIGNQVTINGYLALSNKGSSTGNAVITGLPFLANGYTAVSLYMAQITFADVPMGFSNNGTSTIILRESTNAGVSSTLTDADFANNSEIMFNMTYFV